MKEIAPALAFVIVGGAPGMIIYYIVKNYEHGLNVFACLVVSWAISSVPTVVFFGYMMHSRFRQVSYDWSQARNAASSEFLALKNAESSKQVSDWVHLLGAGSELTSEQSRWFGRVLFSDTGKKVIQLSNGKSWTVGENTDKEWSAACLLSFRTTSEEVEADHR